MFNYETFTNLFVRVSFNKYFIPKRGLLFLFAYTMFFNKK